MLSLEFKTEVNVGNDDAEVDVCVGNEVVSADVRLVSALEVEETRMLVVGIEFDELVMLSEKIEDALVSVSVSSFYV